MIFTFYKARGLNIGASLVEDEFVELARTLEAKAKAKGVQLLLPTDVVVADKVRSRLRGRTLWRPPPGAPLPCSFSSLSLSPLSSLPLPLPPPQTPPSHWPPYSPSIRPPIPPASP